MNRYQIFANAIRCLSIDMVNEAGSGHQGAPLGFADVFSVLLHNMNFSPQDPLRDRLVLSNGHASAMLYAGIFLTGLTDLSISDLKNFRKLNGVCQGHPEISRHLGVDATTGALGQGLATSIGIAIALKKKQIHSKVFVIVGDGDLMEGVSHEALSMASILNLDNLVILHDNNNICIDGDVSRFTPSEKSRIKAYGIDVLEVDGNDYRDIEMALDKAKCSSKPVFISCKTTIGKYSKTPGQNICHGKFLTNSDVLDIREALGFEREHFAISPEILQKCSFSDKKPVIYEEKQRNFEDFDAEIEKMLLEIMREPGTSSGRSAFGKAISSLCSKFDWIIGGSADLSESTCCLSNLHNKINHTNFLGNYLHFGVREHLMGAAMTGLATEGLVPYGGTFLVFSDYMRPAIRNAALMKAGSIFVFTHDSIAVGEDGATHQPIEHIDSLRAIPSLCVIRPSCDIEVIEAIQIAIKNRDNPTAIILSRQDLKRPQNIQTRSKNMVSYGMYEVIQYKQNGLEKLTLIASGSELSIAIEISDIINDFDIRVVSAPSIDMFEKQTTEYKNNILKDRKVIIEAGRCQSLYKYRTNNSDIIISIDEFGESGSCSELYKKFKITPTEIQKIILKGG